MAQEQGLELLALSKGDVGENVGLLQQSLKESGFYAYSITNVYDAQTLEAVKKLQSHYGLETSGVFDSMSWYALSFWTKEEGLVAQDASSANPFNWVNGLFERVATLLGGRETARARR
ncbi:MAG: peptidoglycan-binding domain-containing protein [Cyanobacteria bacterium P01_H01_bin.15]